MEVELKSTVALLAALAEITTAVCPAGCTCNDGHTSASCDHLGLKTPPPGYWPNIVSIDLHSNDITSLDLYSLLGFPNLRVVSFNSNPIRELDMSVLTVLKTLYYFTCDECEIENVIPLPPGTELPMITYLSFIGNQLTAAPDISGFTNSVLSLYLHRNPITLPGDRPLLSSGSLRTLGVSYTDASETTALTFSELPNLQTLIVENANLVNVSDTFASIARLTSLYIDFNNLKVIDNRFLSENQQVRSTYLRGSQLEEVEIAGLKGLASGGSIFIDDTPLACDCKYEALYWWAKFKGVSLSGRCANNPPCYFVED